MSVQHANRGIVKKDLQLYYNREWYKSFKGQSRINLLWGGHFPDGYGMPQEAGSSATNQIIYYPDNPSIYSDYVLRSTALGGSLFTEYQLNVFTIEPSTTYCLSAWYAQDSSWNGNDREIFHCRIFATSGNHVTTGGSGTLIRSVNIGGLTWEYRFTTITSPSDATGYMEWYVGYPSSNTAGFRYYTNLQLEKGTYATPYNDIANGINIRNETVTNLLTSTYSSLYTNWSVDGSGQGSIGTYLYIENNTAVRITDVSSNTRFYFLLLSGFLASTVYTFSVKYRKVSGTPTLRFQIQYYNSSNTLISVVFPTTSDIHIYDKDGWQIAWYTVTTPANTAKITWFLQDGDDFTTYTHSYDLKDPQIQTGKYPTAWIPSSCTANALTSGGGLLDISGNNNNADLANVSFNSNGFTFGGSANYIDLPSSTFLDFNLNNFSIFTWIKSSATANFGNIFNNMNTAGTLGVQFLTQPNNGGCRVWIADLFHSNTVNVTNGSWNYIGFARDGDYVYFYVNGSLSSVGTGFAAKNATPNSGNDRRIGRQTTNTGYDFNGDISNFKIYNKALTAAEVLQNFNATRKTYGI